MSVEAVAVGLLSSLFYHEGHEKRFWVLGFELMKLTIFLFFVTENLCIRPNVFYHEGLEGNEGLKDETFQAVFQDF